MSEVDSFEKHPAVCRLKAHSLQQQKRIVIRPFDYHVQYFCMDTLLFDTCKGLLLLEREYPSVFYVPKADVVQHLLQPSPKTTYCPFKGHASYWSLVTTDEVITNIAWEYTQPLPDVGVIAGYIAFINNHNNEKYVIKPSSSVLAG